ncbi:MAG: hypothetical protein M3O50_19080, partial [Myxococcota bacterium]|nr:hypothetical protein [Myxococcota bacterium]
QEASSPPACPAAELVWATVIEMVPRAAPELLAAKPRVSVLDLDEQYRVRITTDRGTVERTNTDPARDCEKRARFVAEFIVLTLLPPQLGPREAPAPEPVPPPATSPPPPPARTPPAAAPRASHIIRIEIGAAVQGAPKVLSAPSLFSPGAEARVRIGSGRFAVVAGAGVYPSTTFEAGGVRGSMIRVPSVIGLRTGLVRGTLELAADLTLSAAFEAYTGVSVKIPRDSARVAPGVEAAVIASVHAWSRLAVFVGARCAVFPLTREIGATPQGVIGNAPTLWLGGTVGLAIDP